MGVGTGLYMYDVIEKSSRSLSHLLTSSCYLLTYLLNEGYIWNDGDVISSCNIRASCFSAMM